MWERKLTGSQKGTHAPYRWPLRQAQQPCTSHLDHRASLGLALIRAQHNLHPVGRTLYISAKCWLSRAALAWPMCRKPLGSGGNRVTTLPISALGRPTSKEPPASAKGPGPGHARQVQGHGVRHTGCHIRASTSQTIAPNCPGLTCVQMSGELHCGYAHRLGSSPISGKYGALL